MPASPINALTDRRTLKKVVDKREKTYGALSNLLYPASIRSNLLEETAQVDVIKGSYGMAPFVKVGQKAVIMDAQNGTSYTIDTPFINIKRPIKYSTQLAKRIAGGMVFSNTEQLAGLIRQAMVKDAEYMNTLIDNRIEWMVAKQLTGQISYSVEGQDSFVINSGKPAENDYLVSALWNGGSARPLEDIRDAKAVVSRKSGPMPNTAICGSAAASALRGLIESGSVKPIETTSGVDAGRANLLSRIQEDGMMYMGKIGDVDFWEYLGEFIDDNGVTTPLIREDYVEFVSTSATAQASRELMFGVIPDIGIILKGEHITARHYSIKPPEVDQGTLEGIIKSRPLPWFYRPDWNVSVKVV